MLEERVRQAAEGAAYEERMRAVMAKGRDDVAAGRYVEGVDAGLAEIARRAQARGKGASCR